MKALSIGLSLLFCGCGVDNLAWHAYSITTANANIPSTDIHEVTTEAQRQLLVKAGLSVSTIVDTSLRFNASLNNANGMALDGIIYVVYEPDHMWQAWGTPQGKVVCEMLGLLAHEMTHIEQQHDPLFVQKYEAQYVAYGYRNMPYEVAARKREAWVNKQCRYYGYLMYKPAQDGE
jgi:hypothetical protein